MSVIYYAGSKWEWRSRCSSKRLRHGSLEGDVGRLVEFPYVHAQSKSARRVAASRCTHPPFLFRKIKKKGKREDDVACHRNFKICLNY